MRRPIPPLVSARFSIPFGLLLGFALLLFVQACSAPRPVPPPLPIPPVASTPAPAKGLVLYAPEPNSVAENGSETSGPTWGAPDWRDDGSVDSLTAALGQSLAYYRTVPPETVFTFANAPATPGAPPSTPLVTYTADEMARSLELFLTLRLTTPDPQAFAAVLRDKFVVFESVAEQGDNLFTGYYEPEIPGSLTPTPELSAPLYSRPPDLVEVALEDFGKDLPHRRVVGRVQDGRLVPYYSREEIQQGGVLEGRAEPLAYVNEVDLFFLQIQGSGQVRLPDGRRLAVGYDATNGLAYRALGAELIRRNLMAREDVTLFSLRRYLAEHKELVPVLLNTNPSYVFFRKLEDGRGPLGSLRVPLTAGRSLATDRLLLPQGTLAYVMTTVPVPNQPGALELFQRFMLIQDTGGAIRGHGRGDLFWGEGADAEWIAGHAKQPGRLFVLVAKKEALPTPGAPPGTAQRKQPAPAVAPSGRPMQARLP